MRRAIDLALTNRVLSAKQALEIGLVTRVVPDAELSNAAAELAAQLAAGPTYAFGRTKQLLYASFSETLETQMELETRGIAAAAATADGREGIAAFLEKREPHFRGE